MHFDETCHIDRSFSFAQIGAGFNPLVVNRMLGTRLTDEFFGPALDGIPVQGVVEPKSYFFEAAASIFSLNGPIVFRARKPILL